MGSRKKDRYVQFPLCLIKETYSDPIKGLVLMIAYGITHFALKQEYNMQEVVRQLFYDYYRNSSRMQQDLFKRFEALEDGANLIFDDNACFGRGDMFDPADTKEVEYIIKQFDADPQFKDMAVLNYQLHQAMDFLGAEPHSFDSLIRDFKEAEAIRKAFEVRYGPDAMPTCKLSQLYSFRDDPRDIDLLRAYIGCRSIIGKKTFATTHKGLIVQRMLGAKTVEVLKDFLEEDTIPTYEKYSKRYPFSRLRDKLCQRQFMMIISKPHGRNLYISTFMPPEVLAQKVNDTKVQRKINNLIQRISVASSSLW